MKRLRSVLLSVVLAGISASALGQARSELKKPLIYQIGTTVHINASGPRPLLQAVEALQQKYGWLVDYEDPQYAPGPQHTPAQPPHRLHSNSTAGSDSSKDCGESLPSNALYQGTTSQPAAKVRPQTALCQSTTSVVPISVLFSPSRAGFSVQFQVGPKQDSVPDQQTVLNTVVEAYNQSGDSTQFELRKLEGESFAVVGIATSTAEQAVAQKPVLDTSITLPDEPHSLEAIMLLLCREVGDATHVTITAEPPQVQIAEKQVSIGGTNQPARDLLAQTLAATGQHLYWQLLFNDASRTYRLKIRQLPR